MKQEIPRTSQLSCLEDTTQPYRLSMLCRSIATKSQVFLFASTKGRSPDEAAHEKR
jgi:hypothetical protein